MAHSLQLPLHLPLFNHKALPRTATRGQGKYGSTSIATATAQEEQELEAVRKRRGVVDKNNDRDQGTCPLFRFAALGLCLCLCLCLRVCLSMSLCLCLFSVSVSVSVHVPVSVAMSTLCLSLPLSFPPLSHFLPSCTNLAVFLCLLLFISLYCISLSLTLVLSQPISVSLTLCLALSQPISVVSALVPLSLSLAFSSITSPTWPHRVSILCAINPFSKRRASRTRRMPALCTAS